MRRTPGPARKDEGNSKYLVLRRLVYIWHIRKSFSSFSSFNARGNSFKRFRDKFFLNSRKDCCFSGNERAAKSCAESWKMFGMPKGSGGVARGISVVAIYISFLQDSLESVEGVCSLKPWKSFEQLGTQSRELTVKLRKFRGSPQRASGENLYGFAVDVSLFLRRGGVVYIFRETLFHRERESLSRRGETEFRKISNDFQTVWKVSDPFEIP